MYALCTVLKCSVSPTQCTCNAHILGNFQSGDCQSKGGGQGNGTNPGGLAVLIVSWSSSTFRRVIGFDRSVINWRQQNVCGRIRCETEILQYISPILSTPYLSNSFNIIFVQFYEHHIVLSTYLCFCFFNQTSLKLSDTTIPTATMFMFSYFSQKPHGL